MLDEDWSITPITRHVFEKAREQLGTSGSGNHFVEFGILTLVKSDLVEIVARLDPRIVKMADAGERPED